MQNKTAWFLNVWVKRAALCVADAACIYLSFLITLAFRFDAGITMETVSVFYLQIPFIILIYIAFNVIFGLYTSLWEHAGIEELVSVAASCVSATALCFIIILFLERRLPRSVYLGAGVMITMFTGGLRMTARVYRRWLKRGVISDKIPALIIGAGETGAAIIGQMLDSPSVGMVPVCIVDDDPAKRNRRIHGVQVRGTTRDIPALVKKHRIRQVIYAIPSADSATRRRILEDCTTTGCELKLIPSIEAMLDGTILKQLRDVDVGDLLERPQIKLDTGAISGYITGGVILVTGGGGSIGSELCRQIARFEPKKLIIFDVYENTAYELYMELTRRYGDKLDLEVIIGSVRDPARLREVFERYRPDVVFHAAAHKHVPLMETSPAEAVKNNVCGTYNTALAAGEAGVKRFVLISTDKAVNPTNVMGASKYLCELIIQYMNQQCTHTDYVAVRFGNVLGSNGSVIPLFRKQIAAGGPVTVTHKDVTRYFMTIPEAAELVIQAGSMAKQGEIFLLDMGKPVRIDDFARTFIRLSGFEPDVDIKIQYTGLRPGEKMYEELMQDGEEREISDSPGILMCKTHAVNSGEIKRRLDYLLERVAADPAGTPRYMSEVVPTYTVFEISHQQEVTAPAPAKGEEPVAAASF